MVGPDVSVERERSIHPKKLARTSGSGPVILGPCWKHRLVNVSAALGLASIGSAWILGPLVSPWHFAIYHWSGRPLDLFLPALLDFAIAWSLLTALLFSARNPGKWRLAVWAAVAAFFPAIALKSWALYSATTPSHPLSRTLWLGGAVAWLFIVVSARRMPVSVYEPALKFLSTLLAFLSIPGAVLLCQAIWFGWQARHVNEHGQWHPGNHVAITQTKPRIIWVLLDELSYRQVYGSRFPGLRLPAFDALAQQATVFTNVKPAGYMTEVVVPQLLTGQPEDLVRSSARGELLLHDPGAPGWREFNQHHTVFQDALVAGYRTAVVGWYIPYCRVMPQVLDTCFWTFNTPVQNAMQPRAGVWSNMLQPLELIAENGVPQRALGSIVDLPGPQRDKKLGHIEDYERLSTAADAVLADRTAGFVLLHLPIPHAPGIYDRAKDELTEAPASYLDNLALADRYLAHIRSVLERTGQWNTSTLLVMGDHSWRGPMWRPTPDWTAEDEAASHGGQFDTRPFYVVRLAGQQSGVRIGTPFPALATRGLLDALLSRDITSSSDLLQWSQQNTSTPEAASSSKR